MKKQVMPMKKDQMELGALVLRIALGVAFVVAALDKILSLPMATDMFKALFGAGAGAGLLYLAIVIELVGGVMLLLNWHVREAAGVLALFIVVAFVTTFKLGAAPHMIGTLREVLVMNTGGGNTAVNFAYFAMLLSLVLSGCRQCK
ncbi:DoxX family protein [Candidatus Woesearchaeota archaeon]|nr:DoxX family protein [Candidatus Woesearchaeota archaeon]